MDKKFLEALLCELKRLRKELHAKVDDSTLKELDECIVSLENMLTSRIHFSISDILILVGIAFECIPEIAELIHRLSVK